MKKIRKGKKLMLVTSLCLEVLLYPLLAKTQQIDKENRDLLVKNIVIYHVRYAQAFELNLLNSNVAKPDHLLAQQLWFTNMNDLQIEIENAEIKYPVSGYHFYHVIKRGFQFSTDTVMISYSLVSFGFDRDYLVGIRDGSRQIKFFSGNMFLSTIAADFLLKINDPASFFSFLQIRYYNMAPTGLKYIGHKQNQLLFQAYCGDHKELVTFMVDDSNFDDTKFKYESKHHTFE